TLSGLPTARFTFEGFLSTNKAERRARLDSLRAETRTMLFHEAPHKLKATLADLCETFGTTRRIALCRELTKINEEVLRLTLGEAVAYYEENAPRGEYVLVLEGEEEGSIATSFWEGMTIPAHVAHYMSEGMSKKDAIKAAARDRGVPKNEVYQQVLED
ncbi:MAG: 16S rRNA (cytidine(1402)-2'-O)-methyltransferase, partial [Clostridia bacterium]|nr:16S rRNA (cytidine(1402)-2'-O)-methyltransferase [Clostridia bacterium]